MLFFILSVHRPIKWAEKLFTGERKCRSVSAMKVFVLLIINKIKMLSSNKRY